jgi:hypothetical protein
MIDLIFIVNLSSFQKCLLQKSQKRGFFYRFLKKNWSIYFELSYYYHKIANFQGMQCSVKCIYTVRALHHNKNRKIHITLCSVKKYCGAFLHSAVFYVGILQKNAAAFFFFVHILMCTVRKKSALCTNCVIYTVVALQCIVQCALRTENTALHYIPCKFQFFCFFYWVINKVSISISIYFSKKCLNNYNTSTSNKNKKKTA